MIRWPDSSSNFHQPISSLPMLLHVLHHAFSLLFRNLRICHFHDPVGLNFGELEQLAVADQVGYTQLGEASLFGAEELAGAALLQVELGDLKSVLSAHHLLQAAIAFG